MGGGWFSKPWKDVPKNLQDDLNFLKNYQPRNVRRLRILLHGPVGSGKSSFINSVKTVFQNRITGRAAAGAGNREGCLTETYTTYKISKDPEGSYPFVFNDTMGFEKSAGWGVHVEDIKLALKGHVKDGYKFNPSEPLTRGDFYNPAPTLDDRVHVLVSVVPADKLSIMSGEVLIKMRQVRKAAVRMGIPQLVLLTRLDEACPEIRGNIKYAYENEVLKEQAEKCSSLLGIPLNCIFLVKNYQSEIKTSDEINALILVALRQMVSVGEDFLNDLQD